MRLRLGTRRSPLARRQTEIVCRRLTALCRSLEIEVVALETSGDRVRDRSLREVGGKGLFVKELDEALVTGRIDCAVHSLKDVPSEIPEEITIGAVPPREDPRDVLLSLAGVGIEDLPSGSVVGTSSPRRAAQLLGRRPDLRIEPLRGNVGTRLRRVHSGVVGATILAAAGLSRLELDPAPAKGVFLDPLEMVPAPGQGFLGIAVRHDAEEIRALLAPLSNADAYAAAAAERSVAHVLEGNCYLPLGAYARSVDGVLRVVAVVSREDGSGQVRRETSGSPADAVELGAALGADMLATGGAEIVAELRKRT